MPKRSRQTYFVGFLLCLVGALIAILISALDLQGAVNQLVNHLNPEPLLWVIVYIILGIVTLILAVRTRSRREPLLAILILIFGLIFIILNSNIFDILLWAGVLILIGAILILLD